MTAHIFREFPNGKALIIWFSNRNLRFLHLNSVIMSAPVHILQFRDLLRKIKPPYTAWLTETQNSWSISISQKGIAVSDHLRGHTYQIHQWLFKRLW